MPPILLDQVSKSFPPSKIPSLDTTTLTIETNAFVTVLGASGSGKTTLLKLINRLYKADKGQILLGGQNIETIPKTQLRRKIGYVIQQTGLFQHMSVAQNIALVPQILGWKKPRIQDRVNELLSLVGLEPEIYGRRFPRQLSGGQQQRVGLARALAGDPEVLLMDEPFGAIDTLTRTRLQDELLTIQAKLRKTIVFVTHDVHEALRLGDKIIIMNQGRVQQYDPPQKVLSSPANDFVAKLLDSDDPYRHFNLISASHVMIPIPADANLSYEQSGSPLCRVQSHQDLNAVLKSWLLGTTDEVLVENEQHQVIGRVPLEALKRLRRQMVSSPLEKAP